MGMHVACSCGLRKGGREEDQLSQTVWVGGLIPDVAPSTKAEPWNLAGERGTWCTWWLPGLDFNRSSGRL